jgi:hypothetical protein
VFITGLFMPLNEKIKAQVIEIMEEYLEFKRPPVELRHKLDISYRIDGQSVIIAEIVAIHFETIQMVESPIAKATWVASKKHWKVFWRRANQNWDPYPPVPTVKTFPEFVELVDDDTHHCFWG